jgi:hypothetical protein
MELNEAATQQGAIIVLTSHLHGIQCMQDLLIFNSSLHSFNLLFICPLRCPGSMLLSWGKKHCYVSLVRPVIFRRRQRFVHFAWRPDGNSQTRPHWTPPTEPPSWKPSAPVPSSCAPAAEGPTEKSIYPSAVGGEPKDSVLSCRPSPARLASS